MSTSTSTKSDTAKTAKKPANNLFTGVGRLGREPELRYSADGRAWCKTSLAIFQGEDKDPIWLDLKAFAQPTPSVPPAQSAGHGIDAGGWDEHVPLALAEMKKGQKISVRGKLYCDKRDYNGKPYVDWGLVLYHTPTLVVDEPKSDDAADAAEPD